MPLIRVKLVRTVTQVQYQTVLVQAPDDDADPEGAADYAALEYANNGDGSAQPGWDDSGSGADWSVAVDETAPVEPGEDTAGLTVLDAEDNIEGES